MDTLDPDIRDVVYDLVHTARTWAGDLPPEFGERSTRRRVEGAEFSILVLIDGDAGPGPVRLSPKSNPDVDLGGEALHEISDKPDALPNDEAREFVARLHHITESYADNPGPVLGVMENYLRAVCHMLANFYELRVLGFDDDSGEELVYVGDNIAPALPVEFMAVWSREGAL
jgi:hypothetical protein